MKVFQAFENVVQYFSEAFARIFGPNDEPVPSIGVQPFEGEPLSDIVED